MRPHRTLAGFFLSGFLLALLGAILPAWDYHRDPPEFVTIGNYFLCIAVGIVVSSALARGIMARRGVPFLLVGACALAGAALLFLGFVGPPASAWWRASGLLVLGIAAGLLNISLCHGLPRVFESDAAGTVNKGGLWYGLGCLSVTLLVAGAVYAENVGLILATMALVPAFYSLAYRKAPLEALEPAMDRSFRQTLADFRSPGAVLFALLLFFQFGNEWSIAGWLPLFLIRRVGLSPKGALVTLAFYWLFLMAGRLAAVAILPRVRHGRLLLGSVASALFGCLILYSTKTGFGAASAALFIGAGYASAYPLVSEAIGERFPYYHPGFFNGIFSIALLGALLAPATLGYAAALAGDVAVVIGIPVIGACIVMLLILLIWLESKITGR